MASTGEALSVLGVKWERRNVKNVADCLQVPRRVQFVRLNGRLLDDGNHFIFRWQLLHLDCDRHFEHADGILRLRHLRLQQENVEVAQTPIPSVGPSAASCYVQATSQNRSPFADDFTQRGFNLWHR